MIIARQSTARTVTIGPVFDSAGAAVTDAAAGDFKVSKNGGAPAALNGSATLTHRNTGHYSLALTATDLDTVGQVEIVIDKTTDACPMKELTVVEEVIYDAIYAAGANAWSGAAGATTLTALAANSITASVVATDAVAEIQSGLLTSSLYVTSYNTMANDIATIDGVCDSTLTAALAIKAKTDSLTFTVAGQVDANAESINGVTVLGAGTSGNKWRA